MPKAKTKVEEVAINQEEAVKVTSNYLKFSFKKNFNTLQF